MPSRAATAPREKLVCVGEITAPHGLRGEVRIKPFTEAPEDISAYGEVTDAQAKRSFRFERVRVTKNVVVAALAGVDNRDKAEALRGTKLYVAREQLPEPDEEDSWYLTDLIGLEVRLTDDRVLGQIAAVYDFGAGDLLEIRPAGGGPSELLPFTHANVPSVDIAGGRVTIVPPEGLFEGW
jgi:16S rRNA processing protein RimM